MGGEFYTPMPLASVTNVSILKTDNRKWSHCFNVILNMKNGHIQLNGSPQLNAAQQVPPVLGLSVHCLIFRLSLKFFCSSDFEQVGPSWALRGATFVFKIAPKILFFSISQKVLKIGT